ncbi:MAG: transcriptional regulator [Sphingobacteriales bacterium]|nr:MAG: transcriptional regulator [Sphingobacteriales bacterium]
MPQLLGHAACKSAMLRVADALEVLRGKWKLAIIVSLLYGTKRFGQISADIPKITDRMLSKELKDLEINQLVKRTIHNTFPVTVEYSLTEHGESLRGIIGELHQWGQKHRDHIIARMQ